MKILLIYPPVKFYFVEKVKFIRGLTPPLGLLYLAKTLEQNEIDVEILDFSAETYNEKKLIRKINIVDFVGISILTESLESTKKMIQCIKKTKPNLPIIIGGPHCTLFPQKTLEETNADISVKGEGEKILLKIINKFNEKNDILKISGVNIKINDTILTGKSIKPIENLDSLPFPSRNLVKKYTYGSGLNPKAKPGEFTSIITSRGCPFSCKFCSRESINIKYRKRSKDNIIEELKEIKKNGYKYVVFADDCFPTNTKRDNDIFDTIINEKLDLKFYVNSMRVDSVTKDLLIKMKKAGVVLIQFGLESGNQDVLDFYKKNTTVDNIKSAVILSNDIGFITVGTFILGAPFETRKHFFNTIKFAKSLPLDSVTFLPLRYVAGSELWNEAVINGKISRNEYLIEADSKRDLSIFTKEEIIDFCKKAQISFYFNPNFVYSLLSSSLRKNNLAFIQSYISIILNLIKEKFNFYKNNNNNNNF